MINKQVQEAGDNSQQWQANNMTFVNVGIDEKRAREICQEMHLQLRKEYTEEALEVAKSRVNELENRLLSKMSNIEGALEVFADPSFQMLLIEAQKTAASTEREADYDLLSELLVQRFQKGGNRKTRAGINRAVKIVDEISDDALLGLTILHSVGYFIPASGVIREGLSALNDLYGSLFSGDLPVGDEWLEHLEVLGAVRIINFSQPNKIDEIYPKMLSSYVESGIYKNSEDYNRAIELLQDNGLPQNILIEHELNNDYIRLELNSEKRIETLVLSGDTIIDGQSIPIEIPLTDEQKTVIRSIYDLYDKDTNVRKQNEIRIMEEWDKYPHLKKLRQWWDNINIGLKLTSIGKVLAHSNAQRCNKRLPSLG